MNVDLDSIRSMTEALERTVEAAGICPKEMAARLGIGYAHYARMMRRHDAMNFPPDLMQRLMEECKSTLPLEWLAHRMGYRLYDKSLEAILGAIRDSLVMGGHKPRFAFRDNGRLVDEGGA